MTPIDIWSNIQRNHAELAHEIGRLDAVEGIGDASVGRFRAALLIEAEVKALNELRDKIKSGDWLTVPF